MKSLRLRRSAFIIIIALICSMVTGIFVGLNCRAGYASAELLRSNNDGKRTEAFIHCENAFFPMYRNTILTQAAFEQYSHSGWDDYRNRFFESNAMDIQNFTDTYMHAPFTGRIKEYSTACNCFAFESDRKVRFANGVCDYMTVYVLHSDEYYKIKRLMNSSELISQGQAIVQQGHAQGPDDPRYDPHLDIQVHQGINHGIYDDVKLNGNVLAYNAFFRDDNTTFISYTDRSSISNGTYENYAGQWQEDIYNGNWASEEDNVFKYIASPTSTLHVSAPNSLAFEDTATIWEVLMGRQESHYQERLDTIKRIVENYDTIHYEDLNEYEREVYNSIEYEWLPYPFDPSENTEETIEEPKTKTISFYDQFKSAPFEQREYIVGEPLGDLPIISNNDIPDVAQNIRPKHIGWKQYFGKEMITEEFIMPDQDLKLYAVYDDDLTIITLTTAETTTIVTTQTESANNSNNSSGGGRHDNDVTDQPIDNEISIATTTVHIEPRVEYVTGTTPWSEWTYTPIARNNSNIVQEKEVTEQKLKGYRMVTYTTKSLDGTRISDKVDINDEYETKGRSRIYNQYHYEWDYTLAEVEGAPIIKYGETQGGEMASYNYSSTKEDGFALAYGPYTYIFFKKEPLYETVTRKMYRSCQITSTPVYS